MSEQYGFYIRIEIVEPGDWATAFTSALALAREIDDKMLEIAEVVVTATGATLFKGVPNGVYCEGCEGCVIPGIRWPTESNCDGSREWVERCDYCGRYDNDHAAAERVFEEYQGTGAKIERGEAVPAGCTHPQPYVNVEP